MAKLKNTLVFAEDGKSAKILFSDKGTSNEFRSKLELIEALSMYLKEGELTEEEINKFTAQIVKEKKLPWNEEQKQKSNSHSGIHVIEIGIRRRRNGLADLLEELQMLSSRAFLSALFGDLSDNNLDDEIAKMIPEKPELRVCPFCGRHGHFVFPNGYTENFRTKEEGMELLNDVRDEAGCSDEDYKILKEQLAASTIKGEMPVEAEKESATDS